VSLLPSLFPSPPCHTFAALLTLHAPSALYLMCPMLVRWIGSDAFAFCFLLRRHVLLSSGRLCQAVTTQYCAVLNCIVLYCLNCYVLWHPMRRQKDDEAGEVPVAFVVRRAGATTSESELLTFIGITGMHPLLYSTVQYSTIQYPCVSLLDLDLEKRGREGAMYPRFWHHGSMHVVFLLAFASMLGYSPLIAFSAR